MSKKKHVIHIDAIRGHQKMSPDELQAFMHAKKSGHVHLNKSKIIDRKKKNIIRIEEEKHD